MFFCSLLVSSYVYKAATEEDQSTEKAVAINHIVDMQEFQIVAMSEALRGYLLEPGNIKEFERIDGLKLENWV